MQWLLKLIGFDPVGKVVDGLTAAYSAKLAATNDRERIAADVTIKRLEDDQDARRNAKEIRLATAGFWEMRAITALIAAPFVAHLWAVGVDTLFGFGWGVAAFPKPFDEWQGAILLSFFGVAGGVGAVKAIAGAVALRGRR